MKKSIFMCVTLFTVLMNTNISLASYSDALGWWYNGQDTGGSYYSCFTESTGYIATTFRAGDVIFRRDLLAGTQENYFGSYSYLFQSTDASYLSGTEDSVRILYGTHYSSGQLIFNSTAIRYRLNGVWSDWIDLGFSYQPPPTNASREEDEITYDLKLEPYDAYEIKTNIINPGGVYSGTKQWTVGLYSVDQSGVDYDPLNPQTTTVPEPVSFSLLLMAIPALLRKYRVS